MHGFPVPVAEGKWRRSVALYYYTAAPTDNFSGDETTYWREHGELAYRGLLRASRRISIWANTVNPNWASPRIVDTKVTAGEDGVRQGSES